MVEPAILVIHEHPKPHQPSHEQASDPGTDQIAKNIDATSGAL